MKTLLKSADGSASPVRQDISNTSTIRQDNSNTSTIRQDISKTSTIRQDISNSSTIRQDVSNTSIIRQDVSNTSTIRQDISNNQFLMESTSDSDSSIEIATAKSLTKISKKDKIRPPPNSRTDLVEHQIYPLYHQKRNNPDHWSTSDQKFTKAKEILYNLSDCSLVQKSSLVSSKDDKSALYVQVEAVQKTLINFGKSNNIYVHSYDFVSLLATILLLCGKALHCVLHINIALLPLYEIFIHVVRYILDQLVLISEAPSGQERVKASLLFGAQTLALVFITIFIYGSVLFPIFFIGMSIFWKIGYFLLI